MMELHRIQREYTHFEPRPHNRNNSALLFDFVNGYTSRFILQTEGQ